VLERAALVLPLAFVLASTAVAGDPVRVFAAGSLRAVMTEIAQGGSLCSWSQFPARRLWLATDLRRWEPLETVRSV
jgi:hypothetical protein